MEINFLNALSYGLDVMIAIAVLTNKLKKYFPNHKEILPMGIGIVLVILMQSSIGELILGGLSIGVLAGIGYDLGKPLFNPFFGFMNKNFYKKN